MKKVGILGGTFNPPHIGHCIVANEVYHALQLDEVRFMPNAIAPHKVVEHAATDEQRLQMVQLAVQGVPHLTVETIELQQGGVSYSYETMKALVAREPDTEFYFIIGGDSVQYLHTWYEIDQLMELVAFVGVDRPGAKAQSTYAVTMVDIPQIDLSSSLIRERLKHNESVAYLLPEKVEQFIRKERIYGA